MRFLVFTLTLPLFAAVDADQARQAQQELFAARFDQAAQRYAALVKSDPSWDPGYEGWVRALLGAHHATEAYAAADAAQGAVPGTGSAETALAMAAYRRGAIAESERHFRRALKLESNHPGALLGLAQILGMVSKFKTARDLYQAAYRAAPDDPACILAGLADQQEGAEHIATLERVLAMYDPATREARSLRAHVASDTAVAGRKLRRLTSPYQHYNIKLLNLLNGPNSKRGAGIRVEIKQKKFDLLLDTGASGISISPKAAKNAGLEGLGEETTEANGIGDKTPADRHSMLASEVRVGDLTFADVPISAYAPASSTGGEGLIGADVFRRFLVGIDFVHGQMSLDPFEQPPPDLAPDAEDALLPEFGRAFRLGNHLSLMTTVNTSDGHLFLIDSGSTANLIDTAVARETSKIYGDDLTRLRGVQGTVKKVSRAEKVTLLFAGFRQDNPDLIAFDMNKLSDDMGVRMSGILGMPVLGQMKLTIDYRKGAVRLEHVKP